MDTKETLDEFLDEIKEWQAKDNGIVLGGLIVKNTPDGKNYVTTSRGLERFIEDAKVQQGKNITTDQGEFEWFHLLMNELFQNIYDRTHDLDNEKKVIKARKKLYKTACDYIVKIANMR